MCKQHVQSQLEPSQHPFSSSGTSDSPHSFVALSVSDLAQQDKDVVVPSRAFIAPTTNAEAFNEVENNSIDNMKAILLTKAKIDYSFDCY